MKCSAFFSRKSEKEKFKLIKISKLCESKRVGCNLFNEKDQDIQNHQDLCKIPEISDKLSVQKCQATCEFDLPEELQSRYLDQD